MFHSKERMFSKKPEQTMRCIVLLLLATSFCSLAEAGSGGNCENLCKNARKPVYYADCITSHCTPGCADFTNITACKCSVECQGCFADVYNACGGCTNKYGYDFDVQDAPEIKKTAEEYDCNSASVVEPAVRAFALGALALAGVLALCPNEE